MNGVPSLRLYHYWRSSSSWRVRWALAYKEIPCEWVAINLLTDEPESPEHKTRNPTGFVPVLERLDRADANRFLAESAAILGWLDAVKPLPPLFPENPWDRAIVWQLCEIINSGTQPIQNLNVAQAHSEDPVEQKRWNQFWIHRGLEAYELRAKLCAGRFSFGDTISAADFFLMPQLYNADRNEVSLEAFPLLRAIRTQCQALPSYQASHPERFEPQKAN